MLGLSAFTTHMKPPELPYSYIVLATAGIELRALRFLGNVLPTEPPLIVSKNKTKVRELHFHGSKDEEIRLEKGRYLRPKETLCLRK